MEKYQYTLETDKPQTKYLIYKIMFPNNKFYIGMTSQPFRTRISGHVYNSKKRINMVVSRAINKYGVANVKFSIIDYAESFEKLKLLEREWISSFDKNLLYNSTLGGEGLLGKRNSKESMDTRLLKNGNRYFKIYDTVGNYYGEWLNITECERKLGFKSINTQRYLVDKKVYLNKYILIYSDEFSMDTLQERIISSLIPTSINDNILVYDKAGKFIGEYTSQLDCLERLRLPYSPNISKCLNNIMPSHKGYIFIYKCMYSNEVLKNKLHKTNFRLFNVIDENNEIIKTYSSLTECSDELGIDISLLSKCLHGKRKKIRNYHFEIICDSNFLN